MNEPTAETVRLVWSRAGERCEYCLMHQMLQGATFHVEHVCPASRGGPPVAENLALACPSCNLHKSSRMEVQDPQTRALVELFDPRGHVWEEHFSWNDYEILGVTPIGRGTAEALQFNHPRRIQIRMAEQQFGLFPPANPNA